MLTIGKVVGIEMADDEKIYEIDYSRLKGIIRIHRNGEGFYVTDEAGDVISAKHTLKDAKELAYSVAIDDNLIISGHGKHSGRKFWQLPESLKVRIIRMARK